jgi:hypothetical protein
MEFSLGGKLKTPKLTKKINPFGFIVHRESLSMLNPS